MTAPTTQGEATGVFSATRAEVPQRTLRTDKWWLPTLWTNLGFAAFVISIVNTYDAVVAFQSPQGFGFGLGNVILVVNVILLWIYTLSCHSCRHVVGGRLKHFSKHPIRYWFWTQVSKINERHMMWAWITLGTLILTDFYIMLI